MPYGLIYLITNQVNGKVYVGQTTMTLDRRWACHKCIGVKKPKHLISRAINRYGADNFTIDQICTAETREDLDTLEKRCIVLMDSMNHHIGYNMTRGGDGYMEFTDEIRQKMSASQLGRKHTEETKRKIGAKSASRKHTQASKDAQSRVKLGKVMSDDFRARRSQVMTESNPFKGKKHTEETKERMKAAKVGYTPRPRTPEELEKIRLSAIGRTHSDETKQKLRKYWSTDEARKKAAESRNAWWAAKRAAAALNG